MTHMAVDIFPVLNCDIHNEVIGNRQYIGRGVSDDENELEDDLVEEDEYDTDDEEQTILHHNPYILDEVDEEDDNEEDDELEDDGGRTKEEKVRSYVQSLCRIHRNI